MLRQSTFLANGVPDSRSFDQGCEEVIEYTGVLLILRIWNIKYADVACGGHLGLVSRPSLVVYDNFSMIQLPVEWKISGLYDEEFARQFVFLFSI